MVEFKIFVSVYLIGRSPATYQILLIERFLNSKNLINFI